MKRFLALFLSCLFLLTAVTGCGETTPPSGDDVASGDLSSNDASSAPAEEEEAPLPAASTLRGTVHVPPISTQGSIGCCTSMGVTYMQFTIAVSQYLHSIDPDTDWNPSSGNEAYIFSPKFTYNYSGAGTAYCYDVLRDHGCLTQADTQFGGNYGPSAGSKGNLLTQTTEWSVEEGEMLKALSYRLLDYEEIEIGSGLTDNTYLIDKVKKALVDGNAVALCGWSSYWQSTAIDRNGIGTLGKKGDEAIYTSVIPEGSTSDGNHCVCIVGYDDDITVTINGQVMKGAFQVANSWGDSYKNDGYVWMMYDAFNEKSACIEDLNDAEYYNGTRSISFENGSLKLLRADRATYSQRLNIRKVSDGTATVTVSGKEYAVCTISLKNDSTYLAVENGTVTTVSTPGSSARFILVPYADAAEWSGFTIAATSELMKSDGYFLCAVGDSDGSGIGVNTKCFVQSNTDGSSLEVGRLSSVYACFIASGYNRSSGVSSTRLSVASSLGKGYTRTGIGYRFSFIDYRTDIECGLPAAMVEVELSSTKRENVHISISRTDASGNVVSIVPALSEYNATKTNHVYSDLATNLTFSGAESDGTTMEKAYFTIGYNDLSKLMDGYELENFLWGVTVKGSENRVERIALKNAAGDLLLEANLPDGGVMLEKGERVEIQMDLAGELKDYSAEAEGIRRIVSVSDGKYLSRTVMFFEMIPEATDSGIYEIRFTEDGLIQFFSKGENYLFDISGKDIVDGVMVKFNAPNLKKNTQTWKVLRENDGSFRIALAADPTFVICNDPEKGICLTNQNTDSDACKWRFLPVSEEVTSGIRVELDGANLSISGILPEGIEESGLSLEVLNAKGETVETTTVTVKDGNYSATAKKPSAGSYLIRVMQGGKAVGTQCLYKVK